VFSALLLAAVLVGSPFSRAVAQLNFSVDQLSSSGAPGSVLDFTGVITNQTGASLTSTDLFLNFFNFEPSGLTPIQILGSTDFTLPNNTFSTTTDHFSVAISPGTFAGLQPLSVQIGDANGNLSNEVDLSIKVTGSSMQAPEIDTSGAAAALTLLFGGLACLLGGRSTLANKAVSGPTIDSV
jgi:hypothetical protein